MAVLWCAPSPITRRHDQKHAQGDAIQMGPATNTSAMHAQNDAWMVGPCARPAPRGEAGVSGVGRAGVGLGAR